MSGACALPSPGLGRRSVSLSADPSLIVVCGLKAEADAARGIEGIDARVAVLTGGGDAKRLAAALDRLAPRAKGLISFGLAGGLAPDLNPGDLRIASVIVMPDRSRVPTDPDWAAALSGCLRAPLAAFATVDKPLATVAGKAELHRETGAAMVDMESHVVARAAAVHGLRLAAIRVVTDAADQTLPHAAAVGMRDDGEVDGRAIALSLIKNPAQLPALIRTGLDAKKAFAALLRCRQVLGPGFALIDL